VLDAEAALIATEQARLASSAPKTQILDRSAWETLQRLIEAGLVGFTETRAHILHEKESRGCNGRAVENHTAQALHPQEEVRVS
jgi:hypothetical protein